MTRPRRPPRAKGPWSLGPRDRQYHRLQELDDISRRRALAEAESRELERLLCADYARRKRFDLEIPRGVS